MCGIVVSEDTAIDELRAVNKKLRNMYHDTPIPSEKLEIQSMIAKNESTIKFLQL